MILFESMPPGAQAGESIGLAGCKVPVDGVEGAGCGVRVATIPAGVVPPGMMTGMLPLKSPSVSSSTSIATVPRLQLLQEEQADEDDTDTLLLGVD